MTKPKTHTPNELRPDDGEANSKTNSSKITRPLSQWPRPSLAQFRLKPSVNVNRLGFMLWPHSVQLCCWGEEYYHTYHTESQSLENKEKETRRRLLFIVIILLHSLALLMKESCWSDALGWTVNCRARVCFIIFLRHSTFHMFHGIRHGSVRYQVQSCSDSTLKGSQSDQLRLTSGPC